MFYRIFFVFIHLGISLGILDKKSWELENRRMEVLTTYYGYSGLHWTLMSEAKSLWCIITLEFVPSHSRSYLFTYFYIF